LAEAEKWRTTHAKAAIREEIDTFLRASQDARRTRRFEYVIAIFLVLVLVTSVGYWGYTQQFKRTARGETVAIAGGSFELGFDEAVTNVEMEPFRIQRTEVSFAQYCTYLQFKRWFNKEKQNEIERRCKKLPEEMSYPVSEISADDALNYCRFVNGDLPTYVQWERAARGPSSNLWPWGSADPTPDRIHAWFGEYDILLSAPVPVDSDLYRLGDTIEPNEAGIRHLIGNMAEWTKTESTCMVSPYDCETHWMGETKTDLLVVGWGYDYKPNRRMLTETFKLGNDDFYFESVGFRCVIP
jgi:formylglycine-generating enzyme required for sulfatase activity